jgi:integrase
LRGIFQHAVTQGWMLAAQIPKVDHVKQTKSDSRERAYRHFDISEYYKLKRFMTLWVTVNNISERERWRREAVQDYILILLNSGLREHELFKKDPRAGKWRGIRWCDVDRFKSAGNVETVELNVEGKTGRRPVVCQRPVRVILDRRKTLRCPDHKDTDFVMALPDGSLPSRYDSGVRRLLKSAGLLIDPKTGRNRGIYSARHSYATWRLQAGASSAIVADNMGTSLRMLEQHYYHHQSRITADSLMKGMMPISNE